MDVQIKNENGAARGGMGTYAMIAFPFSPTVQTVWSGDGWIGAPKLVWSGDGWTRAPKLVWPRMDGTPNKK